MKAFMDPDEWKELQIEPGFVERFNHLFGDHTSYEDFSEKIGCKPHKVKQIAAGSQYPSFVFILRTSKFFQVSVDYLLGLSRDKPLSVNDPRVVNHRKVIRNLTILREVLSSKDLDRLIYGSTTTSKTDRASASPYTKAIVKAIMDTLEK